MANTKFFDTAGDFQLFDLSIISHTGKILKVEDESIGLNIYESVYSNAISGTLTMQDNQSLIEILPLIGEEKLQLSFSTNKSLGYKTFSRVFDIYKISDVTMQRKTQTYTIYFTTQIVQQNLQSRISTCYKGKGHDIVKNVFDNFLSHDKTPLLLEETKYDMNFVSPMWRGMELITYISDMAIRSVSDDDLSTSFVFFENSGGYNFVSLEGLYALDPKHTLYQRSEQIKQKMGMVTVKYIPNLFKQVENMNAGVYGSTVTTHDIINKQLNTYTHNYSGSLNATTDYTNMNKYTFTSSNYNQSESKHWSLMNTSQRQQFNNLSVVVETPGNSDISAGDTCLFVQPTLAFADRETKHETLPTKYLVASVKHSIHEGKYNMTLDLRSNIWK